jgi:hypothetical protein
MLANSESIPTTYMGSNMDSDYIKKLTYTPSSSIKDNVDWAQAFDISWDGLA